MAAQLVFRIFSEGIILYVAIDLMCPWKYVSSGSSYISILVHSILLILVFKQNIFQS